MIGAGRGVEVTGDDPLARSHASAAGTLAARARRDAAGAAEADDVPLERIADSLRAVAEEVGSTIGRLRMLDYERIAPQRGHVPLAVVIARHGSWKAARAAAAERRPPSRLSAQAPGIDGDRSTLPSDPQEEPHGRQGT